LSPDWILPGNGSAELLTWACWDLAKLESTVVVTPGFGDYFRALKAFCAEVVRCPFEITANSEQEVLRLSASSSAGLLLNNPHNPTGKLFTKASILPYLEQFALVVVDEAFMDFLHPEAHSLVDCVEQYPNLVILRSLTKFYSLAGLRFGYAIAHPDRIRQWQERRDPWSVNTLAAIAAEACLMDRQFQQQTFAWLGTARKQLYQGLSEIPGLSPIASAVNYFLVKSDRSVLEVQQEVLKRHKILIRDCLSFPELGDRYFRVAVRLESENQRLIDGLSEALTHAC
jgi:histidinol-phosphate/aromatic aminotransferase/cobyric acid decarboxylase-like protein